MAYKTRGDVSVRDIPLPLKQGARQRARQALLPCVSRYETASPTVVIFCASSSEISPPNSSSKAIISSTRSSESASRSSRKRAFAVTFSASTPSWSTIIFLTRSNVSAAMDISPFGNESFNCERESSQSIAVLHRRVNQIAKSHCQLQRSFGMMSASSHRPHKHLTRVKVTMTSQRKLDHVRIVNEEQVEFKQ